MTFRGLQQGLAPFGYQRLSDYTQVDGPLPNLLSKDKLPFRQMDWPTPVGVEPNPRRSWEYHYLLQLIGKDTFFDGPGNAPDYDYLNRLPFGHYVEDWRRSWTWNYNLNLIGKDKLPTGDQLYDRLNTGYEPDYRRSWTWNYNLNLIGKDIVPGEQYTTRPDPVIWYQTWTLNLLQSTLIPTPAKPTAQYDWPNPPPVIWYRSWEASYNQNLIGQDTVPGEQYTSRPDPVLWNISYTLNLLQSTLTPVPQNPFVQSDWPNPQPISWYRSWEVNLASKLLPPFNQDYWPLPGSSPPIVPSWTASYNLNLIGKDQLPIRQQDWPVPSLVIWYQDWYQNLANSSAPNPKPFNQQDWPNPGPIPFRDYGYINFTVNIPIPPIPPQADVGGRDWRQYPESLSESFKRIHGDVLQAYQRDQQENHAISDIAAKLGAKGGQARAEALTQKQRTNIATKAALTRWLKR